MDILRKIEAYKDFYKRANGLMVHIVPDSNIFERMPKLTGVEWKSKESVKAYARRKLAFFREYWKLSEGFQDDFIPSIQVLAGTGMVGAALLKDSDLTLEAETNYLIDPQLDWSDASLKRICFNPDNPWFKAQLWILEAFLEDYDGTYGILPYTHFDPLDLANQYRGNDLFMDLELYQDELHELLRRCTKAILELESYLRENILNKFPLPGCALAGIWIPAGNYLSCDAGDLVSPEHLAKFGLPYTAQIVEAWGGGYLHHHELGRHQINNWASVPKLSVQFLNRDFNTKHLGLEMEEEIIASSRKLPIQFIALAEEFLKEADRWAGGKFIIAVKCRTPEEISKVEDKIARLK